ncbi:hypothetical protein PPSIR1_14380 [Plesiocystis pacifica SIR-1]|uniref:FtsH ternary system domain-containing protein n=1 Tax=Plesiocystis pacifica SIR-1 TaxID=391625 RepID=A6GJV9_9BACT|nr:hypothetical protein [Plesiocystis pacifica]EDM73838.1 hypothetical protein PPSIR1_14380 [Plesiocystis pacifica SIR-1]
MSRAYRITISETLRRHIHVADGLQTQLEILEILPKEQTAELLKGELAKAGFTEVENEDGTKEWVRVDEDGVEVRVDPLEGTVQVRAQADEKVNIEREKQIRVYAENDAAMRERGQEALEAELEGEVSDREKNIQAELTRKLEGKLGDLRKELDRVANTVTAEALKRKAAAMGEVQEISEDPESGSLTIRVKI